MRHGMYILDRWGRPKVCHDVLQWASWFETSDRTVAFTQLTRRIYVSTVFLSINHQFSDSGKPVLWETMIFGGPYKGWTKRYTSLQDAKKGHKKAVALAKGKISGRVPPALPKAKAKKRG